MNFTMTNQEFCKSVIAQHDDCDYQESGYLALVQGDEEAICRYGHCSCYDTFADLCGGGISDSFDSGTITPTWSGDIDELKAMAILIADPRFPTHAASSEDCDYDHLVEMYKQVREYFAIDV